MMKTHFDELLEFPTVLNFKVMGVACDELPDLIIAELQKHTPGDYSPKIKPSSKGNYVSVALPVTVTSKEHIEQIYKTLNAIEQVRYVL
jgi:putative lipoic acid-binding regulatory protein